MPKDECRCPDPVACYERQSSYEESGAESCVYCPVASWITCMVVSDRSMREIAGAELAVSAQWLEAHPLEQILEAVPSSYEAEFELQAA